MNHLNKELKLLSDHAFGESSDEIKDGLGFQTYAQVLSRAAIGSTGPFTIGVFGEWGAGKTSLMRMIQKQLSESEGISTVWVNAWRFEKDKHPIIPLMATIIRTLESNHAKTGRLKDLLRTLRAVAYGFSASTTVKVPGIAEIDGSFSSKDMIDRDEQLSIDPLLDKSLYYNAFEKLASLKSAKDRKVVVLIDDLDRCFPELAIKLLESIKLILCQPNFIFVIGVAKSVIEGYLQHRYQKQYGIKDFEGEAYLDKIVQLPFYIPPHTARMETFSNDLLDRIQNKETEAIKDILPIIGVACACNPRTTVRFVNNLIIDFEINKKLSREGMMVEIPIVYFAISRSLQQRWNPIFSLITSSVRLAKIILAWRDKNDILNSVNLDDRGASMIAAECLSDRDLGSLMLTTHCKLWLRNDELRDASINFLIDQRFGKDADPGPGNKNIVNFVYSMHDKITAERIAQRIEGMGIGLIRIRLPMESASVMGSLSDKIDRKYGTCICIGKGLSTDGHSKRAVELVPTLMENSQKFTVPIYLEDSESISFPPETTDNIINLRAGIEYGGLMEVLGKLLD